MHKRMHNAALKPAQLQSLPASVLAKCLYTEKNRCVLLLETIFAYYN